MRVLMAAACPLPWARGTPIRIHRMAEALSLRGHDVQVVTYPLGDGSQEIPYGIHRVASGYSRLSPQPGPSLVKLFYLDPLLCAKMRMLILRGEFDVIHGHHYEGLIASLCARRLSHRVPVIYDAHTLLESELPYYWTASARRWMASLGRNLDLRIPRRADHVIAVSERIEAWLSTVAAIDPAHISIIPNGVELEHFSVCASADLGQRARPCIVFAGNLAEYQGIDLLLKAFARVLEVEPAARLCILTSSAADDVSASAREMGIGHNVVFADPDYASLPSLLAAADVLVNPRINCDGIPQKLLNYMVTARPIVSFESSSYLLEHEKNALIAADGDIQAFAAAVLRLLREPTLAHSLGQAARKKAVAEHGWEKVAEQVESVYARTMERSP